MQRKKRNKTFVRKCDIDGESKKDEAVHGILGAKSEQSREKRHVDYSMR